MDYLPKDPAILVSSVNMLLRDEEFDTLESLCYAFSMALYGVSLRNNSDPSATINDHKGQHRDRSSLDWQKDDILLFNSH